MLGANKQTNKNVKRKRRQAFLRRLAYILIVITAYIAVKYYMLVITEKPATAESRLTPDLNKPNKYLVLKYKIGWQMPIKVTKSEVQTIERKLGIKLPSDYKTIAMKFASIPYIFYKKNRLTAYRSMGLTHPTHIYKLEFHQFFHLNRTADTMSILNRFVDKDLPKLPPKLISFGSYNVVIDFCFDYRKNSKNPEIVLYDHRDQESYLIAKSFSEFIRGFSPNFSDLFRVDPELSKYNDIYSNIVTKKVLQLLDK